MSCTDAVKGIDSKPPGGGGQEDVENDEPMATPAAGPVNCNRCFYSVTPIEDTYPTMKTHVFAAIFFFIGLPFCVCLPYIFDWGGTKVNRCPTCGYITTPPS